ncbi:TMEM165/GDT1 family protein [Sneathiella limimaris]|uniref:TMEM165/GDT1 family protein n=1 Tax=Sneathiella limimaris TaxID=1964213 RepID=UPI0019D1500C|nr:TMEM165/GDT1 family protein [Sneathiella limimaris]
MASTDHFTGSWLVSPSLNLPTSQTQGLMQQLLIIFVTVFLAELGDKTQLATVLFAADKQQSPYLVFMAAALALVASTAIAVVLGTAAEKYLTMIPLKLIAGIGFIAIGAWTVWSHFQTS